MTQCYGLDLVILDMQRQLKATGCCKLILFDTAETATKPQARNIMHILVASRQVTISYLLPNYVMSEV